MIIYVGHSTSFNFKKELYEPLKNSNLAKVHKFIFPHEASSKDFASKALFLSHGCDLVLAEVSFPSTGMGIELGWANANKIKIVCIHKEGTKFSESLKQVSQDFISYKDSQDLISKLII